MERFAIALPAGPGAPADAVMTVLGGEATRSLLARLTDGAIRLRFAWPEASKARLWQLAEKLDAAQLGIINDPTESTWELGIAVKNGRTELELRPRRLPDPRFTYRHSLVPASSHPTLAAALARLAGGRADDIVWDPFVGAGTELIERARLGPYAQLLGTDLAAPALAAARANLAAAGVKGAELLAGDALACTGRQPTLIITNPPMGRRVQRGNLVPLTEAFVAHAAAELSQGGRLVWLSPLPERTAAALARLGLSLVYRQAVDMGGFTAELQVAQKP